MLQLPLLYALFAVLAAALAIVAVWSRRSLGTRVGSVGLLVITLAVGKRSFRPWNGARQAHLPR